METGKLIEYIKSGKLDENLTDIYIDKSKIEYQKKRYIQAVQMFEKHYGSGEAEIFSAPGRSEIGGNHTDHQHGEVLAGAINLDAIGVVRRLEKEEIRIISGQKREIVITDITMQENEKETTQALIKGVVTGFLERGYRVGGFCAYITSDVLIGSGVSSSAAFETLIGTILSGLYNDMSIEPVEIAKIGQFAENVYFGKPCGLMDQMACSIGSLVHIDFKNPTIPVVEKISFDLEAYGYSLCITDTKGSHADLTDEYAAVPKEMKQVANHFGKDVLVDVTLDDLICEMSDLRRTLGDRGVLRALHFLQENVRVQKEAEALRNCDVKAFLSLVEASGNSSYKYLQNVYTNKDVKQQNVSLALALSEMYLGENGVCRVHGGGFAGTIQAFVKNEAAASYQAYMDQIFGKGSCSILKIRKYGGIRVV